MMSGIDPDMLSLLSGLGGMILTKVLDGAVALFKSTVTTPMRLKALEEEHANFKKEIKTNWEKYEAIRIEVGNIAHKQDKS